MIRFVFFFCCLDEPSCTGCYWWLGDVGSCIQVASFVWVLTAWCLLGRRMAPHSSTLAWKIPWMEGPGELQFMGLLGAGHDWATSLSPFTFMHWRRKCNPLQCSCLENPGDGGARWAAVYGVAQGRTRLKRLSSSSSKPVSQGGEVDGIWKSHFALPYMWFYLNNKNK